MLPAELQLRQKATADAETAALLIEAAKGFFTQVLALPSKDGRGRRTDIDRNAWAAASPPRCCRPICSRTVADARRCGCSG